MADAQESQVAEACYLVKEVLHLSKVSDCGQPQADESRGDASSPLSIDVTEHIP